MNQLKSPNTDLPEARLATAKAIRAALIEHIRRLEVKPQELVMAIEFLELEIRGLALDSMPRWSREAPGPVPLEKTSPG